MSNRRSILLLLVIIAASVAANILLSKRASAPVKARKASALVDDSFKLERVVLEREGKAKLELADRNGWKITSPYLTAADLSSVKRFLDEISAARVIDSLSLGELSRLGRKLEDFGLDAPRLRLTLSGEGESEVWSFGDFTPGSNGIYVIDREAKNVLTVSNSLCSLLNVQAEHFRNRDILPVSADSVSGLEIREPSEEALVLSRQGEEWRIDQRTLSAKAVSHVITGFCTADARRFVWPVGASNETEVVSKAQLSGYGLDADNAIVCVFRCEGGEEKRLLIGSDAGEGEVYALVHDGASIVTIDKDLKDILMRDSRLFTDPRLFPIEDTAVRSFSLERGSVECALARDAAGSWRLDKPIAAPADKEIAERFLARILALTQNELSAEGLTVSVNTNAERFTVDAKSVLGKDDLESLRSKEMIAVDPALVKRLVVSAGGKSSVTLVHSREQNTWSVESGEAGGIREKADADKIAGMLAVLNPLKALRTVSLGAAPEAMAVYGLDKPYLTVAIDQDREDAVRRNLLIGDKTEGGRFATIGVSDAIFVLPLDSIEILDYDLSHQDR